MEKKEYTNYQKKVISNYYKHFDEISLSKLQEIVSELYLADSEKKAQNLWKRARKAMEYLQVKAEIIDHIINSKDPAVLAKNIQEWLKL